jgi:hypothetical protein
MKIKQVGPEFAAFLRREMSCEATGCDWWWFEDDRHHYVGCPGCGSSYAWRDTYYLRRIYEAERKANP